MNNTQNTENVLDWMRSNRLYEEFFLIYVFIIAFWVVLGFFTLGFEVQGYNHQKNLWFNFLYFLGLAFAIALTPIWYRLCYGNKDGRSEFIAEQVANIEDDAQRVAIENHLANDGRLPSRRIQRWAFIFLGWCVLFEIFFVTSWVKDMTLVWQPAWVDAAISWVHSNLTLPPINENRKIFVLYFDGSGKEFLKSNYANEQAFLATPFGDACMLFHFWRAVSFFPILIASMVALWQLIGWTGANNLEAKKSRLTGLLWLMIVTFFMTLMMVGGGYALFMDAGYKALMVTQKASWIDGFWLNIGFFFIIIALRLYVSWFLFFKKIVTTIYKRLI